MISLRRPTATAISVAAPIVVTLAIGLALSGCGLTGAGRINTVGEVDFARPLAIPPLATGAVDDDGRRVFDLAARVGETEFRPGVRTSTWGYTSSDASGPAQNYLGPTLVARRGEEVVVRVHNGLPMETTVHWHGMHLPAEMDGGPHQMIQPGGQWTPHWTLDQPAATLWYHPHPHGQTEHQVTRGLAGLFIVQDDAEAALPLPRRYGVDDIPLIVQDARFDRSGQLSTDVRGFIGPIGDQLLVNGTLGPYLDVTTDVVRLRLLNASAARVFNFGFTDSRQFALIGTDGGLLAAPHRTDAIQLSPGERAEVLVPMSAGENVVLRSNPADLGIPSAVSGMNAGSDSFDVLELRAAQTLASVGSIPETVVPVEASNAANAVVERDFRLDGFTINDRPMDLGRIDETVDVDETEIWSVTNATSMPHSFHVHDVQFQVLDVGGQPPAAELSGWKDTVYLRPDLKYRLILRFTDYTNPDFPYMYHCHLLWHEDMGMMGQFVVVGPGQQAGTVPTGHDERRNTMKGTAHDHH